MEKNLENLGYSSEEAKIYLALLQVGQCTAGPIVKMTGLHRQIIYDTLEKLRRKNLVTLTIKSNRKNWQAGDPSQILKQIKSKESMAKNILPELLSIQGLSKHKQEVRVFEGIDGFRTVHQDNIENQPKKRPILVIGSSGWQWIKMMQRAKYLNRFEKTRMGKRVGIDLIFFEKERKKTQEEITKHWLSQESVLREYRYLPDQFQSPVGMQIWHDNITLIIYSEPLLIIQIKNDLIVENFNNYFRFMWKLAKK